MPPSRDTIRLPLWVRSALAGTASIASKPSAIRATASRDRRFISTEPREPEAAVVEAEGERDVVGEIAVMDESGGQPLCLDRVVGSELAGDFVQVLLLAFEVAEPFLQPRLVGDRPRDRRNLVDRAAEDRGGLREFLSCD